MLSGLKKITSNQNTELWNPVSKVTSTKSSVPKAGSLDIYVLFEIHIESRKLVMKRGFKGMKDRTH